MKTVTFGGRLGWGRRDWRQGVQRGKDHGQEKSGKSCEIADESNVRLFYVGYCYPIENEAD